VLLGTNDWGVERMKVVRTKYEVVCKIVEDMQASRVKFVRDNRTCITLLDVQSANLIKKVLERVSIPDARFLESLQWDRLVSLCWEINRVAA
jgi:hypothetical protein